MLRSRYRPADSSSGGLAPVVEASDHSWISLQLSGSTPAHPGALVTGASSGIGQASAMLLAENGYVVAACSRSVASLEAAFSSAPVQLRERLVFCTGDLSTEEGCRQARARVNCLTLTLVLNHAVRSTVSQALQGLSKMGAGLNVLLNNAGSATFGSAGRLDAADLGVSVFDATSEFCFAHL